MLTLWGAKRKLFCDGVPRREFLRIGTVSGLLSLADLFRVKARAGQAVSRPNKAVIMISLLGGPSHLDTYDLKPEAPAEYRGEFQPIATALDGVRICELFPRQAAVMDQVALLRSVISNEPGHGDNELVSGYNQIQNRIAQHPSIGAVVSKVRGGAPRGVPPFVSLRRLTFPHPLPEFEYDIEPGFLGPAHGPFMPDDAGMADLSLPSPVTWGRLEDRRGLLAAFDRLRSDLDASGNMKGVDSYQRQAFEVVSSNALRTALDLGKEDSRLQERYGSHAAGRHLLLARRLVEAGAGFVSVAPGFWDTHQDNFNIMRRTLCPPLDQAFSALLEDLRERGLDQEVLVVLWGDFGRTPRINKDAGRDHWVPVMSTILAGGGLKMGQVIGSSDARGEQPKDRPYRVSQVLSTIYRAIGIDPAMTFTNGNGRPVYLLDDREPVSELL